MASTSVGLNVPTGGSSSATGGRPPRRRAGGLAPAPSFAAASRGLAGGGGAAATFSAGRSPGFERLDSFSRRRWNVVCAFGTCSAPSWKGLCAGDTWSPGKPGDPDGPCGTRRSTRPCADPCRISTSQPPPTAGPRASGGGSPAPCPSSLLRRASCRIRFEAAQEPDGRRISAGGLKASPDATGRGGGAGANAGAPNGGASGALAEGVNAGGLGNGRNAGSGNSRAPEWSRSGPSPRGRRGCALRASAGEMKT